MQINIFLKDTDFLSCILGIRSSYCYLHKANFLQECQIPWDAGHTIGYLGVFFGLAATFPTALDCGQFTWTLNKINYCICWNYTVTDTTLAGGNQRGEKAQVNK